VRSAKRQRTGSDSSRRDLQGKKTGEANKSQLDRLDQIRKKSLSRLVSLYWVIAIRGKGVKSPVTRKKSPEHRFLGGVRKDLGKSMGLNLTRGQNQFLCQRKIKNPQKKSGKKPLRWPESGQKKWESITREGGILEVLMEIVTGGRFRKKRASASCFSYHAQGDIMHPREMSTQDVLIYVMRQAGQKRVLRKLPNS